MSHSPFWDSREFAVTEGVFLAAAARARAAAQATKPTAIAVIGPDHFRNFFYDVMPAFCIGTDEISSFGDYRTPRDDLPAASAGAPSPPVVLARVRYLNTANLRLRSLINPDPSVELETVLLVTNR